MSYQKIQDPDFIKDPAMKAYLSQAIKTIRTNFQSLFNTAVFTQSHLGTSLVYNNQVPWVVGTGSPETVVGAPVGSLYTRTDGGAGTTLYVKESGTGNTGWIAK